MDFVINGFDRGKATCQRNSIGDKRIPFRSLHLLNMIHVTIRRVLALLILFFNVPCVDFIT